MSTNQLPSIRRAKTLVTSFASERAPNVEYECRSTLRRDCREYAKKYIFNGTRKERRIQEREKAKQLFADARARGE